MAKEGRHRADEVVSIYRSLIYVEGDCSMNKFNDKEGKPTSALSIVQRKWSFFGNLIASPLGGSNTDLFGYREY